MGYLDQIGVVDHDNANDDEVRPTRILFMQLFGKTLEGKTLSNGSTICQISNRFSMLLFCSIWYIYD